MKYTNYPIQNIKNTKEIKELFFSTFLASDGREEAEMVENLAADLLSQTKPEEIFVFIATEKEQLVGCIIFTKLHFQTKINSWLLSPVAIQTNFQGQGIGQQLIKFALNFFKEQKVELVLTYGDPQFYGKVGFQQISEKLIPAPYPLSQPIGWLAQSLNGEKLPTIDGLSSCVAALSKAEYW